MLFKGHWMHVWSFLQKYCWQVWKKIWTLRMQIEPPNSQLTKYRNKSQVLSFYHPGVSEHNTYWACESESIDTHTLTGTHYLSLTHTHTHTHTRRNNSTHTHIKLVLKMSPLNNANKLTWHYRHLADALIPSDVQHRVHKQVQVCWKPQREVHFKVPEIRTWTNKTDKRSNQSWPKLECGDSVVYLYAWCDFTNLDLHHVTEQSKT